MWLFPEFPDNVTVLFPRLGMGVGSGGTGEGTLNETFAGQLWQGGEGWVRLEPASQDPMADGLQGADTGSEKSNFHSTPKSGGESDTGGREGMYSASTGSVLVSASGYSKSCAAS